MFGELVELAIRERVDAVAITGDVVDKENKYHEAYGPVERGLKRLAQAGIDVFAVSGNHDWDVLPRLAEEVGTDRFHLLGQGGAWERRVIVRSGSMPFTVLGWSFPTEQVLVSPMGSFPADWRASGPATGLGDISQGPVIGLLHADLDQPDSRYAPVMLGELQAAPVSVWLLGHVHKPRWIAPAGAGGGVLYPGSPQAMDPGEVGTHGPWMVRIDESGRVSTWQIPLSLVQYEAIEIDLTSIDSKAALDNYIPREIRRQLSASCRNSGPMELCSVRARLIGMTTLHRQLRSFIGDLQQLDMTLEGFDVRIDKFTIDTRPPVDLERLSRGSSMVADLASLLLRLQSEERGFPTEAVGEVAALVTQAAELADNVCAARAYQSLSAAEHPAPGRDAARNALLRNGVLLLDTLLAQQESREGE